MRRNPVAGSAVIVSLVLLFSYGVVGTEAIARATRGVINLPRMVRRSADDFQWRGNVRPGGTIEVKGVNGDVTAVPASGPDVEVTAERKARRNNPEDVRLEVVEHADGVTICAVYPSKDANQPNECRPGTQGRMNVQNNDVSVRFVVHVPAGVRFAGRTGQWRRRRSGAERPGCARHGEWLNDLRDRVVRRSLHGERIDSRDSGSVGLEPGTRFPHCQRQHHARSAAGPQRGRARDHGERRNLD